MKQADIENFPSPRLKQEARTIEVMIRMYCKAHHQSGEDLCLQCHNLLLYSRKRLQRCIFQASKPVCGNCTVHCYKREMREAICKVMRYAGPRMVFRHPIMAIRHLLDKRKKTPPLPRAAAHPRRRQQNKVNLKTGNGSEGGK